MGIEEEGFRRIVRLLLGFVEKVFPLPSRCRSPFLSALLFISFSLRTAIFICWRLGLMLTVLVEQDKHAKQLAEKLAARLCKM